MLRNRRKIELVIRFALGFSIGGIVLTYIILLFSMIPSEYDVAFRNIPGLYHDHNEFYLLNIIPFILGAAGAWTGLKVSNAKDLSDSNISLQQTTLNGIVDFIHLIENHDFNKPYKAVNGEIVLATALESMRKSLISTSLREFHRNEINRISNVTGTLLQSLNDLDKLSDETISFLVNNIENTVQGAFYIAEGEDERILTLKSSYAYNRKRYLQARFRFAQGLIGQAAVEKDIIHRTEIPDDHLMLNSDLPGHERPKSLLIFPLLVNDNVYGVIELASFSNFTPFQCNLVKELSKIIAQALVNVQINLKTIELLKESEKMSSELSLQKRQLVRNSKDLLKTQEDLKRANSLLEEQILEIHNINKRSGILLENAKEIITIISEDQKTLYVSPSVKSILGYSPEDLLGRDDTDNIHPLDSEKFSQFIMDLISFPEKQLKHQYRYFTKEGDVVWMEATGKNMLCDNVIKGILVSSRDISEQRIAAKEQRIRAKMQALSENSSDLIMRVDVFGRCTYINPVIESYTGIKKDDYLNKSLGNTDLYPSVVTILKKLLEETLVTREKKSIEMDFPAINGKRIMQVNVIPEFNELGEAESVLYACHDISEAKSREELIKKKNKSISDSINYALNIQSALMPSEEDIRKILPNSFMFYKPKDIVSGDYPWLLRKDDSIYIGAMDCTGHGVPGAMMSIIGYFLQDSILNQDKELNAGDILNILHSRVVKRLKQSEPGSKINDGMDAAFCKIMPGKGELHFSGAHRPLYYVSGDVLTEIKGDKFPVGSTQYRNRKEFTNHILKIKPGDSVYFMTDGYHDQFGGPGGKQRFTSDRIVNLIRENTHLSIFQMGNLFRSSYDTWRGETAQIDDVLVIGIKFQN